MMGEVTESTADEMIESLRNGIPPRRHVSAYAAGTDFVQSVRKRHLDRGVSSGKIRFVGGSWGSGKTHFFRLLREESFKAHLLVSTVELNADQTPFNKFERVFYDIVRNICSPTMYWDDKLTLTLPFGEVLREALETRRIALGVELPPVEALKEELFQQSEIDIDFRRIVAAYWDTFIVEAGDPVSVEDTRGTLLQWFAGEGQATAFRRDFGVQKVVTKENARLVLSSLGHFIKWLGYSGLVIMFDESEMTHSTMRKSSLRQAHNNLLHLINEVDESEGLFMLYAAVPEFFEDEKYGITTFGALAARIGGLPRRPPRAIDKVWNIDEIETTKETYQDAASRIRQIFLAAYPDDADNVVSESELRTHIVGVIEARPDFASVRTWRIVVKAAIDVLDGSLEGQTLPPPAEHGKSILKALQDE